MRSLLRLDLCLADKCAEPIPMATIITPNIPEAELLLGHPIADDARADAALFELTPARQLIRYLRTASGSHSSPFPGRSETTA
ncbi:MAG: hypothetical protein GEV05_29885 [Betaproteobacteria bacterium]|nr:hypothetical protein [Betaproteobacteria bacterium]